MRTAHRFALASDHVRADMVEVSEYPELALRYRVHGVPHTVVNERENLIGAQPEAAVLQAILKSVGA